MQKFLNYKNILTIYENEISKNIKNKEKLTYFELNKTQNINHIFNILKSNHYDGGKYDIFLISEPKLRIVMSLSVFDRVINHFVTRYILEPKLTKYLDIRNIATRKNMGTDYGIQKIKKYLEINKKYDTFYVLKIDISKYFYSINHQILLEMLKNELTIPEYLLVRQIIHSTNHEYINKKIHTLKEENKKKYHTRLKELESLPDYQYGRGLPIGNLSSQFLSVYYLNSLDHKIIHDFKIKCYLRYMDDMILIHQDKEYLKACLSKITMILDKQYDLKINWKKTKITNVKQGFTMLGYRFRLIDKKTIINIKQDTRMRIKRKVKENKYLLDKDIHNFSRIFASIENYSHSFKYSKEAKRIVEKYFWGNE